ncbi:malto-oligosyltrehalose trehalohydrolase [Zafaria cholistanensis]|uniref:Malto-oligosyltrehalose trehalohydrolase n=1 Tax=Zafaria cholistanensis TaxID=1682741 RepID=A0A5A7NRM3_9MICC|nr:malto-oligosyltrehalose trehalohydrolase [Zafaria cholistanensis]GER23460.1 malto-oligosyltrehalose trehalohydrolase [Zafaria cholistanensis]
MDTRFDVWAPRARTVELALGGDLLPMEDRGGGWWRPAAAVPAGEADYGYVLDGGGTPLPDPRSRRQPDGVHGLSRTFDPSGHQWQDSGWVSPGLAGGAIYEMHVGTFTPEGTLDAAAARLGYLADLGVQHVELLPVNGFNGVHNWGYDGVLWYTVHEAYGGPAAYQRFVDAAHRHGLGVVQDVVYNHLGPSGNYLPRFGPYLVEGNANTWGDAVNLDKEGSDEVRAYIVENALMWMRDYHVDGLRLDAVHAFRDERAVHLLEELAAATDELSARSGRPLFLVAESDLNNDRLIHPRDINGHGLAGQWSDDFHHAVHSNLTGEDGGYYTDFASVGALAKVLRDGFFHDGSYSSFRGRHHGRPVNHARVEPRQLVVCTQNHDQIGNRAAGDRITATLGFDQLVQAAVLNLTSPFTPMLFMGEEFAASTPWAFFTSHPEPELGKATAEGRLLEFERMGWDPDQVPDPQDPQTFERSKLNWSEAEHGDHARMLEVYRRLLKLRATEPDLAATRWPDAVEHHEQERWLSLRRGSLAILANLSGDERKVPLGGTAGEVLFGTEGIGHPGPDGTDLVLPPAGAAVVRLGRVRPDQD